MRTSASYGQVQRVPLHQSPPTLHRGGSTRGCSWAPYQQEPRRSPSISLSEQQQRGQMIRERGRAVEEEPEMSGGGGEIKRLIGYKRGEEERERERARP